MEEFLLANANLTTLGLAILVAFLAYTFYLRSDGYQESRMSKRRKKANWKKAREKAEDLITKRLEEAANNGTLDREDVKKIYKLLQKAGLKEMGTEPSFGKPWYYSPSIPNLTELKGRLKAKWDHIHTHKQEDKNVINSDARAKLLKFLKKS